MGGERRFVQKLDTLFDSKVDPASFANVDGEALLKIENGTIVTPNIQRDITPYDCTQPALPPVTLPGGLQ